MAFNGVERQVFHPTLVNVVQHRDAETFQIRMLVDICFERLHLDVFLGLGLPVIAFGKLIGRRFPQSDGLLYIKRT